MKILKCRDMGGDDDFVALGKTDEDVKRAMWQHHNEMHKFELAGMSNEEKSNMNEQMDILIKDQSDPIEFESDDDGAEEIYEE